MMLAMHRCRDFLRRQAQAESTAAAGERFTLT
jgi:hypothetical protein